MDTIRFFLAYVVETLLRLFPFPARTGLYRLGNPGRQSPVFITGNFHLTVLYVKRELGNIDAFLLVANSRGINVWCAAAGGHLTNHSVISVLKTSGIGKLVDHRIAILPQLAATGVEANVIRQRTGWQAVWGPVYATDIPRFLKYNLQKTPEMRIVRFPLGQRVEMAVAWAFPVSLILSLVLALFRPAIVLPLVFLAWSMSLALFVAFPLYSRLLRSERKRKTSQAFGFEHGGLQILLFGATIAILALCGLLAGTLSLRFMIGWSVAALIIVVVLTIDLTGSTPVYKSVLHRDRLFGIRIDEGRCRGVAFCEAVCPRNCYRMDKARHLATIPGRDECVQCGACIVQCPFDALCFENQRGEIIEPETIRRFKLNLMGSRTVLRSSEETGAAKRIGGNNR